MPFHVWACKKAYECLLNLRQHHRGRARRSVDREQAFPEHSSVLLAGPLLRGGPSPSRHLEAHEFAERVTQAVAQLAEADREVLLMRHAEDLSFEVIACILDLKPAAARKRFGRALIRLQKLLADAGILE
jgi:RNA polymerase sigma-70 factor (ECF subfamily)